MSGARKSRRRRAGLPHVEQVRQRTAARIFARLAAGAVQRRVHVHRQVVARLAGLHQRLDEARVVPGGENLLRPIRRRRTPAPRCPRSFAPFFCQRSRSSGSSFSPRAASARMSSAGTGAGESLSATVPRSRAMGNMPISFSTCTMSTVFCVAVGRFQVIHERGERARVGIARVLRERREDLDARCHRRAARAESASGRASPTTARRWTCCSSTRRTTGSRASDRARAHRAAAHRPRSSRIFLQWVR